MEKDSIERKGDCAMTKKIFLYGVLILALILSGTILALAVNQGDLPEKGKTGGAVYLYTSSPLILSDGEIRMLDSTNPDLGATVIQDRTLLPLRSVSEYFGAEVTYDQTKKEAVITYDGKRYHFPVGSKKYSVENGVKKTEYPMDTQSMILDGRTMVPLRVICEEVLGKKVSYYDRVIAVANREIDLRSDKKLTEEIGDKIGAAVKPRTMKELERVLSVVEGGLYPVSGAVSDLYGAKVLNSKAGADGAAPQAAAESPVVAAEDNGTYSAAAGGSDYSKTNVQVEGIDEADIVKTDGKYIYIAGNNVVRIVGTDHGKLSDGTAIRLSTDKNVQEIYMDGNRLIVLGTRSYDSGVYPGVFDPAVPIDEGPAASLLENGKIGILPYYSKTFSFADVYDISNPLRPIFLKGHEMQGSYQSSRKSGEIVYLVTNTYPSGGGLLPMMRDTAVSNQEFSMKLGDVMIMPKHPCPGYLVISAVNVQNEEKAEVEAITAYGATMYMNESSMYLAFGNSGNSTSIIKFELEGMKVGYAGSGTVPGQLLNQFSMDEYEGNLRVATTVWEKNSNGLFILDHSLNIVGSVEDLAKGESIYSVRFLGDKGYVVTFRTIDPLLVFDLSDPKKPVLTGELKVPGFSSYLHPIGNDLLLGIGADAYDIYRKDGSGKEVVVGTRQGGIKFSLFDTSDMGKPKELATYVVGDAGSGSEALYNHKAVMIDQTNENVAIDAYLNYDDPQKNYQQGAIIMNYGGKKLTLKGILDSKPSGVYGNDIPYARRILYSGDELYYVQDGRIDSYGYDSLKQIDSLILR